MTATEKAAKGADEKSKDSFLIWRGREGHFGAAELENEGMDFKLL